MIARSPELARRVVAAAGVPGISAARFLRDSRAEPDTRVLNNLKLTVSYRKPAGAVRLANAYASEFTRYKARVDATWLRDRSEAVALRLKVLRDRGGRNSYEYGELLQQQVDLRTVQQFLEKNPPPAAIHSGSASKPRPDALRNGVIGGAIGALLGVVLMVGLSALGLRARR
jgi:hypothetical protein